MQKQATTYGSMTLVRWLGVVALVAAFVLPAQAQRNVTLRLNTATLPDTTGMAADGIQVRGCLEGCAGDMSSLPGGDVIAWNDNTTLRPPNDGGDYWSIDFQIPDNEQLNFKFYSDQAETAAQIGGWEDGGNHTIDAGTGDVALTLHYFEKGDDQAYDWRPFEAGGDSVAVWFRVYMNTNDAVVRGYDAEDGDLQVGMRGNFGTLMAVASDGDPIDDWGTGTPETEVAPINRESADDSKPGYHLYSGVVKYPAASIGQQANYKFYFSDSNTMNDAGYEDGNNRTFTVPAADSTIYWVYYSNSSPVTGEEPVTSQIIFEVDTEPLVDVGVLDLTRGDEMQVRGAFNGWDCPADNQDDCGLFREPGTFNFGNVVPVTAIPSSTSNYKYFAVLQNIDQDKFGDFGYEEPLDEGGGNRTYVFAGTDEQEIGREFYDDIREGNVISTGTVDVTFRVDMTPALDYAGEDAFDSANDTVYVAFEDQIWRLTQGYEPGELSGSIDPEFTLESVGGNIYEGTYTLQTPTYNGIGYAYAWGSAGGADAITTREGAGGFDPGRRRYRYVTDDGSGNFPSTFAFAQDLIVGSSEPNRWECNPTDPNYDDNVASDFCEENGYTEMPVGIEDLGSGAADVALLQPNYPNPFRGSTKFEYALSGSGPVSLAVYDLVGRRVALLVDEVQSASTYRVDFDAPNLASGVYVVRLQASGAMLTRKITVMN